MIYLHNTFFNYYLFYEQNYFARPLKKHSYISLCSSFLRHSLLRIRPFGMGATPSSAARMGSASSSYLDELSCASLKFTAEEFHLLKAAFKDLAQRSPGKTIDKDTFLKFFPLPGLQGNRLFKVFDKKQTGVIDLEEFVSGLAACCKGTIEEKARFMFDLYDINGDNAVNKQELKTMLLHVPTEALVVLHQSVVGNEHALNPDSSDVDNARASNIVDVAFSECDLNKDGRLSYEQFKMWIGRTPAVIDFLDAVLPFTADKGRVVSSPVPIPSSPPRLKSPAIRPATSSADAHSSQRMEGTMYKVTKRLHQDRGQVLRSQRQHFVLLQPRR